MRLLKISTAIVALLLLFVQTPLWYYTESLVVMGAYSTYEEQTGLLKEAGVDIRMPGGSSTDERDWYPFVMTFNGGEGLAGYTGRNISSTILYNFGAWKPFERTSLYLDPGSSYYNSFYGAYVVRDEDGGVFGFDEYGRPVVDEIAKVPAYDMKVLVLSSIGCEDAVFESSVGNSWAQAMLGYDNWFVYDADLKTNGSYHTYSGPHQAYIQYGLPSASEEAGDLPGDFQVIPMKGRVYGRYFPEADVSVFFYIIALDDEMVEKTEADFIMKSELMFK